MDREGRFPPMTRNEAGEILAFLDTIPERIIWHIGPQIQEFRYKLNGLQIEEGLLDELLEQMIEYIADYDSAEHFIQDYTSQFIAEYSSYMRPYDPSLVGEYIVELGRAMRDSLVHAGLYQYKRSLLYSYYGHLGDDLILARLNPDTDAIFSLTDLPPSKEGPAPWLPSF